MTIRSPIATSLSLSAGFVALLMLAACNKPADATLATTATTSAGATSSGTTASNLPDDVQTAVAVAQALHRFPAKGDSVLTSFHLTANEFAALMKRIAADSTMSAQYRQLTQ